MFLLFLIGLGTAHVNAQVRIGGNSAPQGAAVLDLNADNTATPTANKGALALPRVRLDTTNMNLNGTTPISGMLVWNTNTALGVGVYFWSGSAWVKASLPSTSATDSGNVLMSNGTAWVQSSGQKYIANVDSITVVPTTSVVSFTKIVDTTFILPALGRNLYYSIRAPGITVSDLCFAGTLDGETSLACRGNLLVVHFLSPAFSTRLFRLPVRCYRPSA